MGPDETSRRRALESVDAAIAAYQALRVHDPTTTDRRHVSRLVHALYALSQVIEACLLHGEATDDEPFTDDGVDLLARRPPETVEDVAQRRRQSMRAVPPRE